GQLRLLRAARDGDDLAAHLRGKLDRQVPEPPDAHHRDAVTGTHRAGAQPVKSGDARAQQRCSILGRELVGHSRQRVGRHYYRLGVSAVEGDARYPPVVTGDEISATAPLTVVAGPAEPAHTHAVTVGPRADHARTHLVDQTDHLVTWDDRERG